MPAPGWQLKPWRSINSIAFFVNSTQMPPRPPSGSTANHLFPWFVYVSGCLPVLGAQSKLPHSIHVSGLLSRVFLKYHDKSTTNLSRLRTASSTRAVSLNPPELTTSKGCNSAHTRAAPSHHHVIASPSEGRPWQSHRTPITPAYHIQLLIYTD